MRALIIAIYTLITCHCFSQNIIEITSVELTKVDYSSCTSTQPLLTKDSSGNDTLTLDTIKFRILGVFKSTNLVLLKSLSENSYSLVDKESGWVETLLNFPVFSSDLKMFGCIGPSFGREMIKVYKITGIRFDLLCDLSYPKKIIQINCLSETSFYVKDIDEKCLKYNLEVRK